MNKMCGKSSKRIGLYTPIMRLCGPARSPSPNAKPNQCGGAEIHNTSEAEKEDGVLIKIIEVLFLLSLSRPRVY